MPTTEYASLAFEWHYRAGQPSHQCILLVSAADYAVDRSKLRNIGGKATTMAYAENDLLEHDRLGLGKVLTVAGDRVDIHFKNERVTRRMSAKHSPMKLSSVQDDPYFDRIKVGSVAKSRAVGSTSRATGNKTKASGKYPTHREAVDGFRKIFPLGFNDPKYLAEDATGERTYKVKAHQLWNETLNQAEFARLIAEANHEEVVKRAKQVEAMTNLLSPRFERAALWGAVREPEAIEKYSLNLFDLIYGDDDFEARFNRHAAMLDQLPQAKSTTLKWPALTIFPFLALPTQHLFMKPEATKKAAQRLGFSLNYQTTPNWLTYSCLANLGSLLMTELAALEPRDMFDVQSFIFVTGQKDYPGS